MDAEWDARGDKVNDDLQASWAARPLEELRATFASQPGELRGFLTVVPETRWLKHADNLKTFYEETTEHYEDHLSDLRAILAAAGA
jgi:hypothetical protein